LTRKPWKKNPFRRKATSERTSDGSLRIALVGTRGIPARYGGFETAVEEVGQRLADKGHHVTVYCRKIADETGAPPDMYKGVHLVHLPAARRKTLETLSHTALSAWHLVRGERPDAIILFNSANAAFIPMLRWRQVPVATHVDGLEWQRAKWGGAGRKYYRVSEGLAVRWSQALISDAQGIADYYTAEFDAPSDVIRYGAPILLDPASDKLAELDLTPQGYHVVVARFEPENHVDVAVQGYLASSAKAPLVVVGSAPYADDYTRSIKTLADSDDRVRLLGPVWDQDQLDQLYANSLTYIHGHSVGGTNPSLLRAMGAGTEVLAWDVNFNRETLASEEGFWNTPAQLAALLEAAEADLERTKRRGSVLQRRAEEFYRWDDVADGYEALCQRISRAKIRRLRLPSRKRPSLMKVFTR
jgi:glycosyltransferase involved in cell wall biosynthesis